MIPLLTLSGLQSFIRRAYGRWNAGGGTVTGDYTGVLREINAITPVRNIDWLYTAQGAKTSVAYALNPSDGTGDLAYTGSAGRYFQRNDGLFVASGSNLPPFFKDGLASWQSFNYVTTRSEELSAWSLGGKYNFTTNVPDLTPLNKNASRIVLQNGDFGSLSGDSNLIYLIPASTAVALGNSRTFKFCVKPDAGVLALIYFAIGTTPTRRICLALQSDGQVFTSTRTPNAGTIVTTVEPAFNGYYIVTLTATATNNSNALATIAIGCSIGTGSTWVTDTSSHIGDGVKGVNFAFGTAVNGAISSFPYVKTEGSTITTVDDITTDTDSPQAIKDATELTMFWRGVVPQFVNGAAQQFLHLANNTTAVGATDVISFLKSGESNQLRVATRLNSGTNVAVDFGSINALSGQMLNIAVRAKNNDYAISFNATATQTDATNVYSANRDKISLGMRNTNTLHLNGYTELAFIKSGGLTNAELQALSGVGL